MKKVTDFIEKNCQWLAIGLGGLYLLWMVYSFVLTNAAFSVMVNGKEVAPGEIDETIKKDQAESLDAKMKDSKKIVIPVPSFTDATKLDPAPLPEYALAWTSSPVDPPIQQQPQAPTPAPTPNPNPNLPNVPGVVKVVQLPQPPAPTDLSTADGRSQANIPTPIAPVAAADPNNPQPAAVQQVASASDIDWVTVNYTINLVALAKEFQRCSIPPQQAFTTCVLDVELIRQEQTGENTWGPDMICPKLTTSTQPPFPSAKAGPGEMQAYLTWAAGNTIEILQPKFYDVVKGDPWTLSKDLVGSSVVGSGGAVLNLGKDDIRPGFDPASAMTADPKTFIPPLTNAEKRAIQKAKDDAKTKAATEKAKSNAPARTPRGGGGGGGGGGRGGGAGYAPEDGYRPPGGRPPIPPRPNEGDMVEGAGAPGQGAAGQPSNFSQMFPIQNGEFDPRTLVTAPPGGGAAVSSGSWVCWAHDWKAEPGKTYRYKVRYKIKSPVWRSMGVTKPPQLANEFFVMSADSEWTKSITVRSVTTFYFAATGLGPARTAHVDVWRYEGGQLHRAAFNVSPGDAIGAEKDGIDYSTGFTLVDLRPDSKGDRMIAWMLNAEGIMKTRDLKADGDNPQRKELDAQSAAPVAAAAAGPSGAPPMINPTR